MKVISSLENRGILLKGTTRKITCEKGRFLNFLRPLISLGLPLMKNVLRSLAKSVLVPLRLPAVAAALDAAIQNRTFGTCMTALIISNKEMEGILKIPKSLEESNLLIKGTGETNKNEAKEQKGGSLEISLDKLAASLLGNMLAGKPKIPWWRVIRTSERIIRVGNGVIWLGEETIRVGHDF